MHIRTLTQAEVAALKHPCLGWRFHENLRLNDTVHGLFIGDTLAAYAVIETARGLTPADGAVLPLVEVRDEYQRAGLGRQLVQYIQGRYARLIATDVCTTAARFWAAMGFAPLDFTPEQVDQIVWGYNPRTAVGDWGWKQA